MRVYYQLYMNILPIKMQAEEHTAQLISEAAAELQNKFINEDVNILSCKIKKGFLLPGLKINIDV